MRMRCKVVGDQSRTGKREEKVEVREDEGSRRCPTISCVVSDKAQGRGQARGGMAGWRRQRQ
jgi:hypothetical protein